MQKVWIDYLPFLTSSNSHSEIWKTRWQPPAHSVLPMVLPKMQGQMHRLQSWQPHQHPLHETHKRNRNKENGALFTANSGRKTYDSLLNKVHSSTSFSYASNKYTYSVESNKVFQCFKAVCCNMTEFCVLPTQCLQEFHTILTANSNYFLKPSLYCSSNVFTVRQELYVEGFHLLKPSIVKIYVKYVLEESNMSMDHWWNHNDREK